MQFGIAGGPIMPKCASLFVALVSSALVVACAPHSTHTPPTLTSARAPMYQETQAERELHAGDAKRALATAERREARANGDPWAHYDRAVALDELGNTNEAAGEFREAESRFVGRSTWGRSISLFGRARVLADAGRCREARQAYEAYAALVQRYSPRDAVTALREADECIVPVPPDPAAMASAAAVASGDYAAALKLEPAHGSAWFEYNRAVALAGLHRTDEAVVAYRAAERSFGVDQPRERAISIYGRAHALAEAGRCDEARRAFGEYAALVRPSMPRDAEMAETYARACRPAAPTRP
jgi:tetratricopeptide (TPR) repeat protein